MTLLPVHQRANRMQSDPAKLLIAAISISLLVAWFFVLAPNVVGQQSSHPPSPGDIPFQEPQSSSIPDWLKHTQDRIAAVESQLADKAAAEEALKADEKTKSDTAKQKAIDDEAQRQSLLDRLFLCGDPEIDICRSQCTPVDDKIAAKKWYEKLGIRGYAQMRFNDVVDIDPNSAAPQHVGDRSVEDNQNFLMRRTRLILFGDVSEHVYVYIQPDFSVTPTGSTDNTHFAQMRDWYADLYLDKDKEYRIRVGQSKIPYGWENMQSSSNRLPLDRNDAMNSAARNERDVGVFFYWTPEYAQSILKDVMDKGLKGSGNYGMFAFGAYNGQGGSLQEQNDNLHLISRLTIPMQFENDQYAEVAIQGYTGRYVVHSSLIRPLGIGAAIRPLGTLETGDTRGIRDERIAGTAVWYPQPLGFQAEWNIGRGPALNDSQTAVIEQALYGGYVMSMYKLDTARNGTFFPFARYNYFNGGYKSERNAPSALINEWESGLEWQITPQLELVGMYTITDRTNTRALADTGDASYRQFEGNLMRFQLQFNY